MPKVGAAITVSFALFQDDNFIRLGGRAAAVDVELWRAADGGGRVLLYRRMAGVADVEDVPVGVSETTTEGEYDAVFTPPTAGRYFLVVRDGQSKADLDEAPIDVTANDLDDVAAQAQGYLVTTDGGPYGLGDPLVVTWTFRLRNADFSVFSPQSIVRAELIARDAVTIIQTVQSGAFEAVAFGVRRATFAAVNTLGAYFVRLVFVGRQGEAQTVVVDRIPVENLDAQIVAGVMTLGRFYSEFCGAFPGEPAGRDLLRGDQGEQLIGDDGVAAAIRSEAAYVGRRLGVSLTSVRYATHPDVAMPGAEPLVMGEDYDQIEDPYDWGPHNSMSLGILTLRHGPVIRINRVRVFYGHSPLFQLPVRWANESHKQAVVRIILDKEGLTMFGEGLAAPAVAALVSAGIRFPMAWALDYEAGLTSIPEDVLTIIGFRALARVLTIIGTKANKMGVSSQSTGKDGLSRSISVAADRYQRVLQSPYMQQMMSEDQLNRLRKSLKPGIKVFS